MPLTDTHCHLHLYEDPDAVARRSEGRGMGIVSLPTGPDEFATVRDLAARVPFVHAGAGLVPQRARECLGRLDEVVDAVRATRWVGEIGLDGVTDDAEDRAAQRAVFDRLVAVAAERGDAVLSVHSRRAEADVIDRVGQGFPGTVILHWFSGGPRWLDRVGPCVWFSVNPAMAASNRSRPFLEALPRERVLLESDGPFVHHGDRPAEPSDLHTVVEALRRIWSLSTRDAMAQLVSNEARALAPGRRDGAP